jgi:radical SAM superfamily enzyme YgiQ (UPF0313 family)
MKKVALVNPGAFQGHGIHEPISLGYIAAYLEKYNIPVKIIDQLAGDNVYKELEDFKPDIVGITATTVVIRDAYKVANFCRSKGVFTVMGGVHASVLPEEALRYCDRVVVGEGEFAMLDIVQGKISSPIVSAGYINNIDEIPIPARHLMNMDYYLRTKDNISGTHLYFVPPRTRVAAILTSRGCPYRCIFCYNSYRRSPVRFHSPERVISEIELLIDKYKIQALFFFDDELLANKRRLSDICGMMKRNKIDLMWGCQARADAVDLATLRMVKEAGCRQINFGFESGSQRILDILKGETITVEENTQAIEMCRKVGILSWGTFIIGNPTETLNDIELTRRFIRTSRLNAAMIHVTTPYPGTKLWEYCSERKLIPQNIDWSDFTTAKVSVLACETLSNIEIDKLRIKILFRDIILTGKFDWFGFLWIAFRHPLKQLLRIIRVLNSGLPKKRNKLQ